MKPILMTEEYWANSQFSVARYTGAIKLDGHRYVIVDKTGRSVVVEWIDDKMYVNELNAVTNSVVTPGEHYDECSDWRLPVIKSGLADHNDILTKDQAKELLDAASQKDYTEWSCVYDLNDFSVDVYVDEDYTQAYHYGGKN